eukprot:14807-Heterococcus_DN1.PRE.2
MAISCKLHCVYTILYLQPSTAHSIAIAGTSAHTMNICMHYAGNVLDETWALNPGSFPSDYSFIVYRPASGDVEFSKC